MGQDFNWDDWRSNFNMDYDGWWYNYDMSIIFPIQWEENGLTWMCDEDYTCSYYDEYTQEVCIEELGCY